MPATIINPAGSWSFWPDEMKAALANAAGNTRVGKALVLENDFLKAWTIHLSAGESLPFHKHIKKYFWTVLTEGKTLSYINDGSVIETTYGIGDTGYNDTLSEENYLIHNLINTGSDTIIFSTIEFKQ